MSARKLWTPRDWQPPMLNHLASHSRCALWAKMGAGKTSTSLIALRPVVEVLGQGPGLIIGPKRVVNKTWLDDCAAFTQLEGQRVVPITGNLTNRLRALAEDSAWYSINYENLPWLVEYLGRKNWRFKTVIADEATKLKSFRLRNGSQRAAALAKRAFDPVEVFVELTGTPVPNGLHDLWGQMWFLDRGERLGRTIEDFNHRWFRPKANGFGLEPFDWSDKEIHDAVADICLTIDPADYLPFDPVIEVPVPVELPPKARQLYKDMEKTMYAEIVDIFAHGRVHEIEAVNAGVKSMKCMQLANGAAYTDDQGAWAEVHVAKLDALESVIEEAGGAPVLCSYQFKSDAARIKKRFPFAQMFDDKPATEDAWNAGKFQLMLAHPASAGHGSNLQHGGNILCDFSSGWNLEHDDQIIERLGPVRQFQSGYDRPVYRYRIEAENTVDGLIAARRTTKRSVQDLLLEAAKRSI